MDEALMKVKEMPETERLMKKVCLAKYLYHQLPLLRKDDEGWPGINDLTDDEAWRAVLRSLGDGGLRVDAKSIADFQIFETDEDGDEDVIYSSQDEEAVTYWKEVEKEIVPPFVKEADVVFWIKLAGWNFQAFCEISAWVFYQDYVVCFELASKIQYYRNDISHEEGDCVIVECLGKVQFLKEAAQLYDLIILNCPYINQPRLYVGRLECLEALRTEEDQEEINKFEFKKKELIKNYLFSCYINENYSLDVLLVEDIAENGDSYFQHHKDFAWIFMKLLKAEVDEFVEIREYWMEGDWPGAKYIGAVYSIYDPYSEEANYYRSISKSVFGFKQIIDAENEGEEDCWKQAVDNFEDALEDDPRNALASMGLGYCAYHSPLIKNNKVALSHLEKAASLHIVDYKNYKLMAEIYLIEGNVEKADQSYRDAMRRIGRDGLDLLAEEATNRLKNAGMMGVSFSDLIKEIKDSSKVEEVTRISRYVADFNPDLPMLVKKEIDVTEEELKKTVGEKNFGKLSSGGQQLLKLAEGAYRNAQLFSADNYFQNFLIRCAPLYQELLEHELNEHLFRRYKETVAHQSVPSTSYSSPSKESKCFEMFMTSGKNGGLTLGQILGILTGHEYHRSVDLKKFFDYAQYTTNNLCLNKSFLELLSDVNKMRNNVIHRKEIREHTFKEDFSVYREAVIGAKAKKGALVLFLESYSKI